MPGMQSPLSHTPKCARRNGTHKATMHLESCRTAVLPYFATHHYSSSTVFMHGCSAAHALTNSSSSEHSFRVNSDVRRNTMSTPCPSIAGRIVTACPDARHHAAVSSRFHISSGHFFPAHSQRIAISVSRACNAAFCSPVRLGPRTSITEPSGASATH